MRMSERKLIFVQLGLDNTFEYAYLGADTVEGCYRKYYEMAQHFLFLQPLVNFQRFTLCPELGIGVPLMYVVGVEMSPEHAKKFENLYKDSEYISVMQNAVSDKNGRITTAGWSLVEDFPDLDAHRQPGEMIAVEAVTLETLFDRILQAHPTGCEIFGLSMNVEAAEHDIIEAYNFKYKPRVISISQHDVEGRYPKTCKILSDNGYSPKFVAVSNGWGESTWLLN